MGTCTITANPALAKGVLQKLTEDLHTCKAVGVNYLNDVLFAMAQYLVAENWDLEWSPIRDYRAAVLGYYRCQEIGVLPVHKELLSRSTSCRCGSSDCNIALRTSISKVSTVLCKSISTY